MRTSSTEYNRKLYLIKSAMKQSLAQNLRIPESIEDEAVYEINLDERTINAPVFLSVQQDHTAETVFFQCDRYYDNVDLAEMCCLIQYVNANNEEAVFPVLDYDKLVTDTDIITGEPRDVIVIPWVITGKATAAAGKVRFSVRFFNVEEVQEVDEQAGEIVKNYVLTYNLSTIPATSLVKYGLTVPSDIDEAERLDATFVQTVIQLISDYSMQDIYWTRI